MKKTLGLTLVGLLISSISLQTFAADKSYLLNSDESLASQSANFGVAGIRNRIYKGDSEISPDFSFSYSQLNGVGIEGSVAYRYFFADKISIGIEGRIALYEINKSYSLGPSMRWYFYETGRWAFSLTQALRINHNRVKIPGLEKINTIDFTGQTDLGIHYFVTPDVALSWTLGSEYNLSGNRSFYGVKSKFGVSFQF